MSFSQYLHEKYAQEFIRATTHPFTKELCQGTLDDDKLLVYLVHDLRFFEVGLRLLSKATSLADDSDALITLAKQIGVFAGDENSYFHECIEQLKLGSQVESPEQVHVPRIDKYVAFLLKLLNDDKVTYKQLITVYYVMEKVYLEWATENVINPDLEMKHQQWIDLHSGDAFEKWTLFLKNEVDRVGDETVESYFKESLDHEFAFFDDSYKSKK